MGDPVKNEIERNKESPKEFHRPFIRKLEKPKVHSSFIDSIWCADLADVQLLNRFDWIICFFIVYLLIFIVIMIWSFIWKIKKELQLLMLFTDNGRYWFRR